MFYSQFILAKKGPLGTIWVAAHLERKLRKNQVADTDIGDSVDSILQPEVPIALRLSSHLLLGVVRIYSRKVNYLFDDCSEALLKVKQAFRATDVDLPPEETTAPYNSITLPETFDLDDFELPDNEIFQGNHANHHTSTMDQITLQDNMEGVVYSASQFGLDDTFGVGETSSLNLDEGLVLHKEDTAGHAAASSDHQLSAHAASPKQDEGFREMPANQESRHIENLDLERDLTDYAQAPSTPGLVETPNIANVQEISACEDHMDEDEDLPLVVSVADGSSETISGKSSHFQENAQPSHSSLADDNLTAAVDLPCDENQNHVIDLNVEKRFDSSDFGAQNVSNDGPVTASVTSFAIANEAQALGQAPNSSGFGQPGHRSVPDDKKLIAAVDLPSEENRNHLFDLNIEKRLYSSDFGAQNVSIDNPVTASRTSFAIADEPQALCQTQNATGMATLVATHRDRTHDLENVNLKSDGVNGQPSVSFKDHGEYSAIISKESSQEASFSISSLQLPRGVSDDNQIASYEGRSKNMEVSRNLNRPVCSDGTLDLNFEHRGLSSVDKPEDTCTFNGAVSGGMPRNQVHILRPCRTGLELSDSSHNMAPDVGALWESRECGERIHVSGPAVVVQDNAVAHNLNENHTAGPGSIKDVHAGSGISYNQVNNVGGDSMLKNVSGSLSAAFSAPEKQYSVLDVHNNQPRDIPESVHMYNGPVFDENHEMSHTQLHILRPSRTGLELSDSSHYMAPDVSAVPWESPGGRETIHVSGPAVSVQGLIRESPGGRERIHMSRPAVVVQDDALKYNLNENRTTGPGSIKGISGSGKSYNQVNNVVGGDGMLKNVSGSFGAMFPASENQLSVLDAYNNQPRDLPEVTRMFNGAVFDVMPRTQLHNLRPCRTGLELADSSHDMAPDVGAFPRESPGGGERIHVSRPAVVVQDDALERNLNENQTAGPYPIKDIHADFGKSYNQVNNVVGGDSMFKNVSGSLSLVTSAPEKQWSVQDVHNTQPRDLPENTRMFNGAAFDEMSRTQLHMLRPSRTGLELADSSHGMAPNVGAIPRESSGGWERIHRSGPAASVQDNALERNLNENRTADIHAGYGISYNQVNNVVGGNSMFKNVSGSPSAVFSAPEKLMSALDVHNNQPRDLPQDTPMFNGVGFDEMTRTQLHISRPYRTGLEHTDSSHPRGEVSNVLGTEPNFGAIPRESPGGWESFHVSGPAVVVQDNALAHNLNQKHTVGPGSIKDIHAGSGSTYNQVNYAVGGDSMLRNVSGSLGPMYSAPETMMSVPDVRNNQPRGLPVQATPGNLASLYENDAGSGMNSWKKRSYTESTPTQQSLNSVESARVVPTKRSGEAIRDDNDYLSSILVGRGSSALKVNSTPPPPPHEMTSVKRQRRAPKAKAPKANTPQASAPQASAPQASALQASASQAGAPRASAPRASAYKRKVLMDDMLVLHGDIIRQQLINTADIRRLRKKAPCARPETSVILKLSLEDEIFGEPLCSGTSVVLASLFNQSYNISRIKISKDDVIGASALSSSDKKFISANERIENAPGSVPAAVLENDIRDRGEYAPTVVENDTRDRGEYAAVKENTDLHLDEAIVLTENKSDAYVGPSITNLDFNPTENKDEIEEPVTLPNLPQNITENEIMSTNVPSEVVDIAPMPSLDKGVGAEASVEMETEAVSFDNDESGSYDVMLEASSEYGSERDVDDVGFDTVNSGDTVTLNEVESNDKDIRGSKNVMLDASLENGSSGYTVTVNEVESNDNYISESTNMMVDASLINGSERNDNDVRFDPVNSGVNTVTVNEIESDNDISGSKIVMLDDSLINGSKRDVNDVRFDTVNGGDTVTLNEGSKNRMLDDSLINGSYSNVNDVRFDPVNSGDNESNEKDAVLSEGDKRADTVETESLYSEQVQRVEDCSPSTELENDASRKNYNEPSCGPTSGGSPVVTSLYPPGFGASGGSPAVTSLYPPGFGTSGGSPAVTSLYPPGFGTSAGLPVVTSLYPPGFGTSGGSPAVTSLYPPGFDSSVGSPVVTSLYPPGFGDVQDPVLDGSKSPIQQDVDPTNAVGAESSDDSKCPIQQDVNPTNAVVAESPGLDTQDYNDINSPADADDTGFLNDDDDDDNDYEVAEEADDDVPNAEDTRFIENSGWSSRTRAVANYLQTVFTREAEYDKKVVPIDNLLVGKTRKEACRMFFETLVLKTKDYIQVEQEGPFGNINVKPKMKLLKSDF